MHTYFLRINTYLLNLTVIWTSSCEFLVKYHSYKSQQYLKIRIAMYDGTLVKSKIQLRNSNLQRIDAHTVLIFQPILTNL